MKVNLKTLRKAFRAAWYISRIFLWPHYFLSKLRDFNILQERSLFLIQQPQHESYTNLLEPSAAAV